MSEPPMDIERVVNEVLAELGLAGGGTGGSTTSVSPGGTGGSSTSVSPVSTLADKPPVPPTSGADKPPVPPGENPSELVLHCRVVTMSEVEGRLGAVRRLVVPPQAVVTPAVRDELHRRNVSLAYGAAAKPPAASGVRLVVLTVGESFDPAPLFVALGNEGIEVRPAAADCLISATDRLAAEMGQPHTLGLLLTRHTAAALCLANRHRGVRAVEGIDARSAAAGAGAVGANLLVVDPAEMAVTRLRQTIIEYCRGGPRACPEVFRERLG